MQIPAPMIKFPIQQASLGFMSQVMWGNLECTKESSRGADGPDEALTWALESTKGVWPWDRHQLRLLAKAAQGVLPISRRPLALNKSEQSTVCSSATLPVARGTATRTRTPAFQVQCISFLLEIQCSALLLIWLRGEAN